MSFVKKRHSFLHPQDSLYASKSTIDFGESLEDRWRSFLNQLEYIDPRGYINIGTRQSLQEGRDQGKIH